MDDNSTCLKQVKHNNLYAIWQVNKSRKLLSLRSQKTEQQVMISKMIEDSLDCLEMINYIIDSWDTRELMDRCKQLIEKIEIEK